MKLTIHLSLLALLVPTLTWAEHPYGYEDFESEETETPKPKSPEEQKFDIEIRSCEEAPAGIDTDPQTSGVYLTKLERKAIAFYIGTGYSCLNSHLRSGDEASIHHVVSSFDSALAKFPKCKTTIYRGEAHSSAHALPKQGQWIRNAGYLSTSTDAQVAASFGPIRYEIHAISCRDLSTVNRVESEVICPRNIAFKVRSVKVDGNVTNYVLDEIIPAPPTKVGAQALNKRLTK